MSSTTKEVTCRISGTMQDSIVDGPGLRYTVFFQGCPHNCPECHNPQTHDPQGGELSNLSALVTQMQGNPILKGLTLSGGEPFLQAVPAALLAAEAHKFGLDVWCYTGMTWEQVTATEAPPTWQQLLLQIDVLVDGPFLRDQRSLDLRFCGSRNQRLIAVPASLAQGTVVLYQPPQY